MSELYRTLNGSDIKATCRAVTTFKSTYNTKFLIQSLGIINLLINLWILAAAVASNRWLMGFDSHIIIHKMQKRRNKPGGAGLLLSGQDKFKKKQQQQSN